MKSIAFANDKGGVAKSTSVNNVAVGLNLLNKRVLVIDMDDQADVTKSLAGGRPPTIKASNQLYPSTYSLLIREHDLSQVIVKLPDYPNISLIPSNSDLAGANVQLSREPGGQTRLRKLLHDNAILADYDYVLIDVGKGFTVLAMNVYSFTDNVIVMTKPGMSEEDAIVRTLEHIETVREDILMGSEYPRVIGIVIADQNTYSVAGENEKYLRETYQDLVFKTVIRRREEVQQAWSRSKSVFEHQTSGDSKQDYGALVKEVINRVN